MNKINIVTVRCCFNNTPKSFLVGCVGNIQVHEHSHVSVCKMLNVHVDGALTECLMGHVVANNRMRTTSSLIGPV